MEEPAPKRLRTVTADHHIHQPPHGVPGPASVSAPAPVHNAPVPVSLPRQDPRPVDAGEYFFEMVEKLGPSAVVRDLLVKAATRDPVIAAELAVAASYHEAVRPPHPGLQQQQMYSYPQPLQNGNYYVQQPASCYPQQYVPTYAPQAVRPPAPYPGPVVPPAAPAAAPAQSAIPSDSGTQDTILWATSRSAALRQLEEWTAKRREEVDESFEAIEKYRAQLADDAQEFEDEDEATEPEDKDFSYQVSDARDLLGFEGRFNGVSLSRQAEVASNCEHRLAAHTSTMVYNMSDVDATWGTKRNAVAGICDILLMVLEAPEGPGKKHNMSSHSNLADNFRAAVKLLSPQERKDLSLDEAWKKKLSLLWSAATDNSVEVSMNVRAVKDLLKPSRVLFPDEDAEVEEGEEVSVHTQG